VGDLLIVLDRHFVVMRSRIGVDEVRRRWTEKFQGELENQLCAALSEFGPWCLLFLLEI
jgi:hypothetical protein